MTLVVAAHASAPPPHPQLPARTAARPLHTMDRRLARNRSEVLRLRQDVAAQEARSRQAAERLQRQDQAISALRRQLEALQGSQAADPR